MNKQRLVKNLDGFPQNPNIFLQTMMTILKSRCHSKIIQFFNYYLNEIFPWKLSLLSNKSITCQWLLFYLRQGKIKSSHKIWITVNSYFIKIYKMMFLNMAFEVMLAEGNFQFFLF